MTIDPAIRKRVIIQYLNGFSRDRIAADNGIGQGTVSNFLADFKKGVQDFDLSSLRELTIYCKDQGINLTDLAQALRIKSYLERLGLDIRDQEESVENLMANLAMQPGPTRLIEIAGRIASDTPLEKLEELQGQIETKRAENDVLETQKKTLLTEIEDQKLQLEEGHKMLSMDKKAAEDFLAVKEEMIRSGIGESNSSRFLNVINTFKKYNYDPSTIMGAFAEVMETKKLTQLKKETDDSRKALDTILSTLGIGLDQLKPIIISLMTLEDFGINYERIISISRAQQQRQQQQWKRGQEWDAQYLNQENNGGYGQEYGYTSY